MWIKHHLEMVDLFVSPSQFLRHVYQDWGIPLNKIVDIPHGYRPRNRPKATAVNSNATRSRNRFAFFGQLIDNKGLLVLFDAIRILRSRGIKDFTVDIHGANLKFASEEFQKAFSAFEAEEKRSKLQRVRQHGAFEPSDLDRLMTPVDWVIVPSTWWENSPIVIVEAFMFGKPVICSNIGGMSEAVRDDVDGLHFVARNSESLADTMARAMSEDGLWERLHGNTLLPPTAASMARQHIELCYDTKSVGSEATRSKDYAGWSEAN
jgi:glycosyltransferase involved in cell wall biosynthesis